MNEKNFTTKKSSSEEDVIDFYNKYANTWDARFVPSNATKHFIDRRFSSFSEALENSTIDKGIAIELGIGTGVYIDRVSKKFNHVIGVDGSQKMLEITSDKILKSKIYNVTLINSNVIDLRSIESSSVDCVYFFGLIEHIVSLQDFAKEIRRVLKPSGIVIGVTPNGQSPWYFLRRLFRGTGRHCSTDIYHSEISLDELFLPLGLVKVSMKYWGATPAGVGDFSANILIKMEPFLEMSFLKKWLGGLTFVYRR